MAIHEILPRARSVVAWYGSLPPADVCQVFERRNYRVECCTDDELQDPKFLAGVVAVIFQQLANKPMRAPGALEEHAKRLLDHDCHVVVVALTAWERPDGGIECYADRFAKVIGAQALHRSVAGLGIFAPEVQQEYQLDPRSQPATPHVHLFSNASSWETIANALDTPPGPPPSQTLKITGDVQLSIAEKCLLRRAFFDCEEVHLAIMEDEGKSGASVFRGFATLQHGLLPSRWPQPYFVKLGKRDKIFAEFQNYKSVVDPYVPFYLGPRLIYERCHLGADMGVIVGDFVDRSESLWECAQRGRAGHAISALINTTLHGWYRGANETNEPLTAWLRVPAFNKSEARLNQARRLGAKKNPQKLKRLFSRSASMVPVLVGPVHGDLHAGNVLVRGGDAIIIDFGAHQHTGPLLYDLACLEASLFVDGFAGDKRSVAECLASVEVLYRGTLLEKACPIAAPKDASAWYFSCVSEIRRYAREMERHRGQYGPILAIALLRKASKDRYLPDAAGWRRAAAYVLAEKLLTSAFTAS